MPSWQRSKAKSRWRPHWRCDIPVPHGFLVDLLEALLHEHDEHYPRDCDEKRRLGGHIEQLKIIEDGNVHVPDTVEYDGNANSLLDHR